MSNTDTPLTNIPLASSSWNGLSSGSLVLGLELPVCPCGEDVLLGDGLGENQIFLRHVKGYLGKVTGSQPIGK